MLQFNHLTKLYWGGETPRTPPPRNYATGYNNMPMFINDCIVACLKKHGRKNTEYEIYPKKK